MRAGGAGAPEPGRRRRRDGIAAALWGFAEATLFFLVPDVLLTAVALRDRGGALRACLWAAAGALAGGAAMWSWGAAAPDAAFAVLAGVPAVSTEMLARVRAELLAGGWLAVVLGPTSGTPYKLYAATAGALGMPLAGLLAVTVPARLLRFVALTLLAGAAARGPLRGWSPRGRLALHLGCWTAFYGAYFAMMEW